MVPRSIFYEELERRQILTNEQIALIEAHTLDLPVPAQECWLYASCVHPAQGLIFPTGTQSFPGEGAVHQGRLIHDYLVSPGKPLPQDRCMQYDLVLIAHPIMIIPTTEIEYSPRFFGGDYDETGDSVHIPYALIEEMGSDEAAFEAWTRLDQRHIISISGEMEEEMDQQALTKELLRIQAFAKTHQTQCLLCEQLSRLPVPVPTLYMLFPLAPDYWCVVVLPAGTYQKTEYTGWSSEQECLRELQMIYGSHLERRSLEELRQEITTRHMALIQAQERTGRRP